MTKESSKDKGFRFTVWHVLTGAVIWGAIGYVAIFLVLDSPNGQNADGKTGVAAESVVSSTDQLDHSTTVDEANTAADNSANSPIQTANLSSSWMTNTSLSGGWYVHVGSYKSTVQANVERLKYSRLNEPVQVEVSDDELTHLFIGPFETEDKAIQTKTKIESEFDVRRVAIQKIESAQSSDTTVSDQPDSSAQSSDSSSWYIQIGAFNREENALKAGDEARSKNFQVRFEPSDQGLIRVLIGPYPTRDSAANELPQVTQALSLDTVILREIEG